MSTAGVTIFGVLNVTRDSFSDGGRWLEPTAAIDHAGEMLRDGADVIDAGAASSHPEAEPVTVAEEIRRLEPVLRALTGSGASVSVDSCQIEVQRYAIGAGASWLNDIRGFCEPGFYGELAACRARLILMHSITGAARATREHTEPAAVLASIDRFFDARVEALVSAGIDRGRLVLDPGMGLFLGADPEPSVAVLRDLPRLCSRYRLPVMISVSRKSVVGRLAGRDPGRREAASLAAELYAIERGATLIRTHEPRLLRDALAVLAALRESDKRP